MQIKQTIIFIFFIIFIGKYNFGYSKEPEKSLFLNHKVKIECQIRYDLTEKLSNIRELEIIPVPFYEMLIKDQNKISLELDTLSGFAIILSDGEFVDYALKLNKDGYKLCKFKEDTTIYLGRNVIFSSDDIIKCYGKNLFAIYFVDPYYMLGFGVYKNLSIKYFSITSTNIIKFKNNKMFFKYFENLTDDYDEIKKYFENK